MRYLVMGGIDGAFMSTTTNKDVAMSYAASKGCGIVFEIQQGINTHAYALPAHVHMCIIHTLSHTSSTDAHIHRHTHTHARACTYYTQM